MGLFTSKATKTKRQLESILQGVEVPGFPELTLRILKKVRDLDNSIEDVVESLQYDPALVVRILRAVNTAAYGPRSPIANVGHAVSYLGRARLEEIVLSLAVRDVVPSEPAPGFDARRFWATAAFRATVSRRLAERVHPDRQDYSFTGGLLLDIAIPVIASARASDYGPVLLAWHEQGDAKLVELEKAALGWTHEEVGGLLARSWEFPDGLVAAIEKHHHVNCTDQELVPSVKLVALLRETQAEHGMEALIEEGRAEYGLGPDWTCQMLSEAESQAGDLASMLA